MCKILPAYQQMTNYVVSSGAVQLMFNSVKYNLHSDLIGAEQDTQVEEQAKGIEIKINLIFFSP